MKPILLGIAVCISLSLWGEPSDASSWKKLYDSSMNGDTGAIKRAIATFERLRKSDPIKPELLVFEGSLKAKLADEEFFFWDKIAQVNEGIGLMKRGIEELEKNPDAYAPVLAMTLHLVRGITSGYIPEAFQPREVARKELSDAMSFAEFKFVLPPSQAEALTILSLICKKDGKLQDSEQLLAEASSLDRDAVLRTEKKF